MSSYASVGDMRAAGVANPPADDAVQAALNLASLLVDGRCGSSFATAAVGTVVFYDRRTSIVPLQLPLSSVTHIDVGGYTLNTNEWALDGQILRLFPPSTTTGMLLPSQSAPYDIVRWVSAPYGRQGVTVTVTGAWGWLAVPPAVKQATILIAQDRLNAATTTGAGYDSNVRSVSVEGFSVTLADPTPGATSSTGNVLADRLLAPYVVTPAGIA